MITQLYEIDKRVIQIKKAPFIIFLVFMFCFVYLTNITFLFLRLLEFPFNLVHELGHFIFALILVPEGNPEMSLDFFSVNSPHVTYYPSSDNWEMALTALSGPSITVLLILLILYSLKGSNYTHVNLIRYYLLFNLLNQFPNLIPILPEQINMNKTDGYGVYSNLSTIFNLPPIPESLSLIFIMILFFCGLLSYYYISVLIYESTIQFKKKTKKIETSDSI